MQRMSQLERLGLMRNPKLSMRYVIALLETPSEELNMTRKEHVDVLIAAAVNPELIGRSRRFGRKAWVVDDFPADPFKEFGKMWQLCLEKWIDDRPVWFFISYIQTTPEVKLAAYTGLLGNTDKGLKGLRQEVIRTCDPLEDAKVLKLA
jgi:hypothetical protein